jgi:hypothetical protein
MMPAWQEHDHSSGMSQVSSHSQIELISAMHEESPAATRTVQYRHLKERIEPSSLLFYVKNLSQNATSGYMSMMGYLFFLLNFRYVYLRIINSPNDLVSLLMINILAQMGMEFFSKLYLVYGGDSSTLFFKQTQLVFGWKSVYLLTILVLSCVLTVKGTVSDFPWNYNKVSLIQMAAWRGSLALFCFLLSNDNTHMAHLYSETFFTTTSINGQQHRIFLTSFIDKCGEKSLESNNDVVIVEKSSQADILNRVKDLMPTYLYC